MTRRMTSGWFLLGVAFLAGCGGGETYVVRYPQWDFERYERIAVLPGKANSPEAAREAALLADRLTTLLAQNGAFKVLSRSELKDVMQEQDLSRLTDAVDSGTALPEGMLEVAQAVVAPTITDYRLIRDREQREIVRYARDDKGRILLNRAGQPIIAGKDTVWVYKHAAEVEGSVRVVDAATNRILLSHSARIEPRPKTRSGSPPDESPEELASEAAVELSTEFYKSIAPTRVKVKLDGDMLIVATDYFDGRYDDTNKLPRTLSEFLLVVRGLPPACERNDFRVAIAAADGRENLFEGEFTWSSSFGREGMSFKVPMESLNRAAAEKFVAKLYSVGEPEPILTREFSLTESKKND